MMKYSPFKNIHVNCSLFFRKYQMDTNTSATISQFATTRSKHQVTDETSQGICLNTSVAWEVLRSHLEQLCPRTTTYLCSSCFKRRHASLQLLLEVRLSGQLGTEHRQIAYQLCSFSLQCLQLRRRLASIHLQAQLGWFGLCTERRGVFKTLADWRVEMQRIKNSRGPTTKMFFIIVLWRGY